MKVCMVVAVADNDVIGAGGDLPWHLPGDLRRFRRLTLGQVVVAGRRTQDSIVARLGHPLDGRLTIVISGDPSLRSHGEVIYQTGVDAALNAAQAVAAFAGRHEVFVIGGARVYAQALPRVSHVYLTRVHQSPRGDAAMPVGWLDPFELVDEEPPDVGWTASESGAGYTYQTFRRR